LVRLLNQIDCDDNDKTSLELRIEIYLVLIKVLEKDRNQYLSIFIQ